MSRIIKSIIFFIFAVLSTASSNSYGEEIAKNQALMVMCLQ